MTKDPWLSQPDVDPYPMAYADPVAQRRVEQLEAALADAERRGAEKGWDEGHAAHDLTPDEWINPYRKEAE